MGNYFVILKKKLKPLKQKFVWSKNVFTYRSRSKDDCNNKSEEKMSSKKTSSGKSIKTVEMSFGSASGSRKSKRKIDEISSREVDRNTFKVPKPAPAKSKTDSNVKGKKINK